jgi:hypothetical protein
MALVQAAKASGGGVTSLTTGAITTTSANAVCMSSGSFSATSWTPSDSKTNSWTEVPTNSPQSTASGDKLKVWTAKNISGGASHTFTVTISPSDSFQIIVHEYSGRDTTSLIRNSNGASSMSSGTTHTGPSVTASAGDDIAAFASDDDNNQIFTGTGSYTVPTNGDNPNGNSYSAGLSLHQDNVSAGNYTPTWSATAASTPGIVVLALAVAGGAAATRPVKMAGEWLGYAGYGGGFAG